jgi:hypothetical protein
LLDSGTNRFLLVYIILKETKIFNQDTKKGQLTLQQNKDICTKLQQYARENLSELLVGLIVEYLHYTILPSMVKERSSIERSAEEYALDAKKNISPIWPYQD